MNRNDSVAVLRNIRANGFDFGFDEDDYAALDAAIAALSAQGEAWRAAVTDACVIACIDWDEADPAGTLKRLIEWRVQLALDPAVSDAAQALMEQSRLTAVAPAGMGGWQPIETAPKDGTDILVCCANAPEPRADVAHWNAGWVACSAEVLAAVGEEGAGEIGEYVYATHWQHLPTPPATAGEE